MRNPTFCICENQCADQLRGNRAANQRICFRYIGSTIPLLPEFQASSHFLSLNSPVCVGPGRKPLRQVFLRVVAIENVFCFRDDAEYLQENSFGARRGTLF